MTKEAHPAGQKGEHDRLAGPASSGHDRSRARPELDLRGRHLANEREPAGSLDHSPVARPSVRLTDPLPRCLPPEEFLKELIAEIRSDAEANIGPFYQALFARKVAIEGVRAWIKQWYYEARTFPPLVAQMIANCSHYYDARQFLGANLMEELGELNPSREHPVLFRRVGRALGISDEEMEYVEPIPEVLLYVEYRHKLVRDSSFIESVAAGALAVELMIPARYRRIAATLKEQFGLDDEALEFFYIHAGRPGLEGDYGGDVRHAMEAGSIIKKYATTVGMQDRVRLAVWQAMCARRVYQWGLFRECVLKWDPAFHERYGLGA